MWKPFRSKLAAAILGGVDKIHIKPGSKVLYLGPASGTTVSHVTDIVGPVSALMCENVAMKLQPITIHPMTTSSHHHSLHPLSLHHHSPHHYSPITIHPHPISTSLHHHSPHHHFTISPNHSSPSTHSLTGGSGVCCGVLSPLREGPDQRSQEENQHHSHHQGRQTPAQVQDAGR